MPRWRGVAQDQSVFVAGGAQAAAHDHPFAVAGREAHARDQVVPAGRLVERAGGPVVALCRERRGGVRQVREQRGEQAATETVAPVGWQDG